MNKKLQKTHKKNGFTLIEALVALSILITVATYPLVQLGNNSVMNRVSEQRMQAVFLTQEGIEAVRAVRDAERFQALSGTGSGELTSLDACTQINGCFIDIQNRGVNKVQQCSTDPECGVITYDISQNTFTVRGTEKTIFKRKVSFTPTEKRGTKTVEGKVSVSVEWNTPQGLKKVNQDEYLRAFQ